MDVRIGKRNWNNYKLTNSNYRVCISTKTEVLITRRGKWTQAGPSNQQDEIIYCLCFCFSKPLLTNPESFVRQRNEIDFLVIEHLNKLDKNLYTPNALYVFLNSISLLVLTVSLKRDSCVPDGAQSGTQQLKAIIELDYRENWRNQPT